MIPGRGDVYETKHRKKGAASSTCTSARGRLLGGLRLVQCKKILRDITERKRIEEAVRTLSLVDEYGLYNRRGFHRARAAAVEDRRAQPEPDGPALRGLGTT